MKKEIKIGLIGHKFMGKAHNHAYTDLPIFFEPPLQPVKQVLCGRGADLEATAKRWGWKEWTDSWEEVVNREDIDLVDIAAPSAIHKDVAIAAARVGKHVFCEKPLALNLNDAQEMLFEVEKADVKHTVGFNYRKVPAIKLARRLIKEGYIGRIFHFRGIYSQDWLVDPNFPLTWRLRKKNAGGGSSWDLGAHVIDLAKYLVGDLKELTAMQTTFIKERPTAIKENGLVAIAGKGKKRVDVDDATSFLAKFKNGALGIFELTRYGNGYRNQNRIEVIGSKGSFIFDMEKMNELEFFSNDDPRLLQGFRRIQVTDECHPYTKNWWPVGHIIGFGDTFVNEMYDFLIAIAKDEPAEPNFYDGVKVQEILSAIDESIKTRKWVEVEDIKNRL